MRLAQQRTDRHLNFQRCANSVRLALLATSLALAATPTAATAPIVSWQFSDFMGVAPDSSEAPPKFPAPTVPSPVSHTLRKVPRIAIVLDDIGYQWQPGLRAIDLPGEVTLAILPFSPAGARLAKHATAKGREIMLHAPMEPTPGIAWEGGLRRGMSDADIRHQLAHMISAVPGISGVNNHMGSSFTESWSAMESVMAELVKRQLYFVDSRTSAATRGFGAALNRQIPAVERDVFLDNIRQENAIEERLEDAISVARRDGFALAIGHPYPETLAVLERALPALESRGVELVPVSQLLGLMEQTLTDEAYRRVASNPNRRLLEQIPICLRRKNSESI